MSISELVYDGFLRMKLEAVLRSDFIHLMSEVNPCRLEGEGGDSLVWMSGYSEWYSLDPWAISIGWDWKVNAGRNGLALDRVSLVRSNVMLVDGRARDFGWIESLDVMMTVAEARAWRLQVVHNIPVVLLVKAGI